VRDPRIGEERREPAKRVSGPGAFLFGYFLLGKQEKVPRRRAREPASKSIAPARRSYKRDKNKKSIADEIRSYKDQFKPAPIDLSHGNSHSLPILK